MTRVGYVQFREQLDTGEPILRPLRFPNLNLCTIHINRESLDIGFYGFVVPHELSNAIPNRHEKQELYIYEFLRAGTEPLTFLLECFDSPSILRSP